MDKRVEIFISYAHEDEEFRQDLEKHLKPLQRQGLIHTWYHYDIEVGKEWSREINIHLNTADIILLLISPDFIASDYLYSIEITRAMERHETHEACVIPIILRPTNWQDSPLGKLQALPKNAQPITTLNRDAAFLDIIQEIQRVLKEYIFLPIAENQPQDTYSVQNPIENPPHQIYGEEPSHPEHFYGRKKELSTLEEWICRHACKIIGVLGAGGIGKTALAMKITEQIKLQFDYIYLCSLQNAPSLQNFLKNCFEIFSTTPVINLPPDEIDEQILLLIKYLQKYRCLLLLDNVESILKENNNLGSYREGYEHYGKFFLRVAEAHHQSCLLLTSREKPKEIAYLQGNKSSVRSLELSGISQEEGKELLHDQGLFGSNEAWKTLIHLYSGNPLALKLVSEPIREIFGGDISEFLGEGGTIFGDIRYLLDQQFSRLSPLEREIMYWLAIEREALSLEDLQAEMAHAVSKGILLDALIALRRRSMIESNGNSYFTLQPVILEYMTNEIINRAYQEISEETFKLLANYSLMKAQAKDFVRKHQVLLILAPLAQRLLTNIGKETLQKKLENILKKLHHISSPSSSYSAGNILNLLIYLQCDLRFYDFSHLRVWQADLRGTTLVDVNFTYADLTKSVFTDAFTSILSTSFNPQGDILVAGTSNGEVWQWKAINGQPLFTYLGHTDGVCSVAFHPLGTILATGSSDQTIRLWDVRTGRCLKVLEKQISRIWSLAFSPDGTFLASGGDDHMVRIWEVSTGSCQHILPGHTKEIKSIAFSSDGILLASGSTDQTIRLWEVSSGDCLNILNEHTGPVRSVTFSYDGAILVSGGGDQIIIWQADSGRSLRILQAGTDIVRAVAISFDGTRLASGGEDQIVRLWEVATGRCLHILEGHRNRICSISFSSDRTTLASGGDDQSVRLWEIDTGRCLNTLQGYANRIWSIAFNPQGNLLASGNDNQTICLWDVRTGRRLHTFLEHTDKVRSVVFNHDGTILASGSEDNTICLWDVRTGRCINKLQGHTDWIRSVAFNSDSTILASGSDDQTIRLWDVKTGYCLFTKRGHEKEVRSVAFHPSGTVLASGGADQRIRLWEVKSGNDIGELRGHLNRVRAVTFSPDGEILASSSEDQTLRLWKLSTKTCFQILQDHTDGVRPVAFNADGTLLASGCQDRAVRLWNVHTGRCLYTMQEHDNRVRTVAFSPDEHLIASGSDDGTIKLWEIHTGNCLKTLREDRPYERMNITGAKGLTAAQKETLRALGAIEI